MKGFANIVLSLQYYVIVILLHRPFLGRNDQFGSLEGVIHHNKVCLDAAEQITAIMKAYKAHYSLVRSRK